jgi:hypothetical protein
MLIFLGDINENKIIMDEKIIERHIEISDSQYRSFKYKVRNRKKKKILNTIKKKKK